MVKVHVGELSTQARLLCAVQRWVNQGFYARECLGRESGIIFVHAHVAQITEENRNVTGDWLASKTLIDDKLVQASSSWFTRIQKNLILIWLALHYCLLFTQPLTCCVIELGWTSCFFMSYSISSSFSSVYNVRTCRYFNFCSLNVSLACWLKWHERNKGVKGHHFWKISKVRIINNSSEICAQQCWYTFHVCNIKVFD